MTGTINLSINSGQFPDEIEGPIIRPLLKKPNIEHEVKNYRPVSSLSFVSKLTQEAVCQQLRSHISTCSLAEKFQSAYRKHHSTETALVKVLNDILLRLDNREIVFMNLLDLSAKFDTLDHDIMLRRLR